MIKMTSKGMDSRTFIKATFNELLNEKTVRKAWFRVGKDLYDTANNEILRGKKTGRIYRKKIKGGFRRHQSSAPGETHANFTGKLRRSMGWKVAGRFLTFGYGVPQSKASEVPVYAKPIEEGSKFIKPRPSLRNSVKANIGKTQVNMRLAFEENLKR